MFEFVISTDISHFWLGKLKERLSVSVVILDLISDAQGMIHYLIDVKLESNNIDLLRDTINELEGVEVVNISGISRDSVILTVCVESCDICQTILTSGCFLESAWTEDECIVWNFLSPKKEYLKTISDSLDDLKIRYELKKIRSLEQREVLTPAQEEVLGYALDMGYYDFPKKIGITEIGARMGVSNATISEILRRGTKNLVSRYLMKHDCHPDKGQ